ncbi:DUF305 domain-containing protein [Deinococcus aquatilis]|uniref:DUF305 domain-containing protein n=1 Tax=Deinococcus aquatilis TaxID=519440 RepID=UPI0004762AC7|nr:DUF305 domain-containing protein [Deinococcus aquatilis]
MKTWLVSAALMALPVGAAQAGGTEPVTRSQMEMGMNMQPMLMQLRALSGTAFDRAFFSMMIPHHQSAIDMSRAALPRLRDPLVRAWAQSIISDQQKEIAEMQSELQRLGGMDTARMNLMRQMMANMPQMTTAMANSERSFLEMMVPHHGSANDMANIALQRSSTEAVLGLAQRIMTAQADEMHDFKDWLRTRP